MRRPRNIGGLVAKHDLNVNRWLVPNDVITFTYIGLNTHTVDIDSSAHFCRIATPVMAVYIYICIYTPVYAYIIPIHIYRCVGVCVWMTTPESAISFHMHE